MNRVEFEISILHMPFSFNCFEQCYWKSNQV